MEDDINRAKSLFELNERVFAILGVWPLRSNYIKFTLWVIYDLIHLTMLFADLFYQFGNLEAVVTNLTETTISIMILLKMMVMRFSRTLVKLMIRIIEAIDVNYFENVDEIRTYLNYNRTAERFFKLWLTMGIVSAIIYNMRPLEFRLKSVLLNESMPFVLAHRTRLFFEITESTTFWLVWVCQWPVGCMAIFHTATIGYLFSLVLHVCGQLSVLTFRVKNLDLSARENRVPCSRTFRSIVDQHLNILELAQDINRVFGILLLEELIISTLLIGLTSYSALQNIESQETAVFISYFSYGLTMLLLIYGYCFAGEYLISESKNLYEAFYQCQWYDMSNSFKKQLAICMIGATKPIQLNAGGFYIFSLVNFTSVRTAEAECGILKSSAGYISMLRTMT